MIKSTLISFILATLFSFNLFAANKNIPALLKNKDSLIENQYQNSIRLLLENLSPVDGMKGAVIAAPSRSNPDYYYNWVRDAALTAESLVLLYPQIPARSPLKVTIKNFLLDYVEYNVYIQQRSKEISNLGEPKFYVNGSLYTGPWGRPQNDGPALRSSTSFLILNLANQAKWPEANSILSKLYVASLSKPSLIKDDLEFVAHHWMDSNFDLWEEVNGNHFYTLMTQRRALYFGAYMANSMKDSGASQYYQSELQKINSRLENFWSPSQGYILATLFGANNAPRSLLRVRNKSQLDIAVLLGALHAEIPKASFNITDPRVFSTYLTLKNAFGAIYTINKESQLNTSLGRYPEDTYDGYVTSGRGNPWVLSTASAAEYLYRLAHNYLEKQIIQIDFSNAKYYSQVLSLPLNQGQIIKAPQAEFKKIVSHLINDGDLYLMRIIYHANQDGSLSEQFNRENGYMQGAPNLTWSHASFITAKLKRDQVINAYKRR